MTRCLCFAPRNGCHAHACPFPLFGGSPVERRRWHAERRVRRELVERRIRTPDPAAQDVLSLVAERIGAAP